MPSRNNGAETRTSAPRVKCPDCGSDKVVRHCKGTFQYNGFICIDCLTVFGREGNDVKVVDRVVQKRLEQVQKSDLSDTEREKDR